MTFLWAAGSSREDDRVASSRLTKQYHCGYSNTAAAAGCFLRRTRVKVKKQLLSLYMLLCVAARALDLAVVPHTPSSTFSDYKDGSALGDAPSSQRVPVLISPLLSCPPGSFPTAAGNVGWNSSRKQR